MAAVSAIVEEPKTAEVLNSEKETSKTKIAEFPLGLNKSGFSKLRKQPSICNWRAKKNKQQNCALFFEHWEAEGYDAGYGRYPEKGTGFGMKSGVKSSLRQKFSKYTILVREIHYDKSCDSWLLKDDTGKLYRASWANAYQHQNHPQHKDRGEVDFVINSCLGVVYK